MITENSYFLLTENISDLHTLNIVISIIIYTWHVNFVKSNNSVIK